MQKFTGLPLFLCCLCLCFSATLHAQQRHVKFNQYQLSRGIASVFLLPGEAIKISATSAQARSTNIQFTSVGNVQSAIAPQQPGLYKIDLYHGQHRSSTINLFVLVPYQHMHKGKIEGYRIDDYPEKPMRGLDSYKAPKGFVRVSQDMLNTKLSPHFTLKQFLCKQKSGYPKFFVTQTSTLQMLETFLDYVNQRGYNIDTFGFISAYRTPFYNRSIGNVKYSRHVYGDAIDLFIDDNKDGRLDDLNKDGKNTIADVYILFDLAKDFHKQYRTSYVGGIGKYKPTHNHAGFVHIDNRGYIARW